MDFAEQMERVNTRNPFLVHNGIRITALSSEMAEAEAGLEEFSMNMMAFRFLRAAGKTDRITAKAVIIKRGRSLSVCRAEIFDPQSGKLLAEGEYQFAAL